MNEFDPLQSVPEELRGNVDWYNPTPGQIAALGKHRGFVPDEIFETLQAWSNFYTADFVATRNRGGVKQFLLTRRTQAPWKGQFFVPGGRIKFMEVPMQACIRHVKRELGIDVTPESIRLAGFVPVLNPESQKGGVPWCSTWCLHEVMLPENVEIILDETANEFQWFGAIQPEFIQEVKFGLGMIGGFPIAGAA